MTRASEELYICDPNTAKRKKGFDMFIEM
jgi:hypothetical protein